MRRMPRRLTGAGALNNERGMALVLAIGMIAILSLLGVVVLSVTNRDIVVSGDYAAKREAFYAAERAVEYAMNRDLILSLAAGTSENLLTGTVDIGGTPTEHKVIINAGQAAASGGGELVSGSVVDNGPGELPSRIASKFGTDFGANYYNVSVSTKGPRNTRSRVDTQIVRLFKIDDDSIFFTSKGG